MKCNSEFMSKAVLWAVLLLFYVGAFATVKSEKYPDFAYPESTQKISEERLSSSLNARDYPEALKYMLWTIVARQSLSPDNITGSMTLCDSVGSLIPAPYSGLVSLIEARMLMQMYEADRYAYSRRELPLDSLPDNPAFWDMGLFCSKICSLTEKAITSPGQDIPLKEIAPILKDWKMAADAGLTVADFVRMGSVECLSPFYSSWGIPADVIPFYPQDLSSASSPSFRAASLAGHLCAGLYDSAVDSDMKRRVYLDTWLIDVLSKKGEDPLQFILSEVRNLKGNAMALPLYYDLYRFGGFNSVENAVDEQPTEMPVKSCSEELPLSCFGRTFLAGPIPSRKEFYADLESLKSEVSRDDWEDSDLLCLNNMLQSLSVKKAGVEMPGQFLPDTPVSAVVSFYNANEAWLHVYSVDEELPGIELNRLSYPHAMKEVACWRVRAQGKIPFAVRKQFSFETLPEGRYLAVLSWGRESRDPLKLADQKHESMMEFRVSSLALANLATDSGWSNPQNFILVADGRSGAPLKGASVDAVYRRDSRWQNPPWSSNGNDNELRFAGKTDASGLCPLLNPDSVISLKYDKVIVEARKDGQYTRNFFNVNSIYRDGERIRKEVKLFTDLSIFRPGDAVEFSGVAYSVANHRVSLLKGEKILVSLIDPTGSVKDTLVLETDADARFFGNMTLPEKGLLGGWSLNASASDKSRNFSGMTRFEVAEYKVPSFYVTASPDVASQQEDMPDSIAFSGSVLTYSGVPLKGARVRYSIEWRPFWWRRVSASNASYGGEVEADANGYYVVKLPTSGLRGTPFEYGVYTFRANAFSPAGESQESEMVWFCIGDGLIVSPNVQDRLEVKPSMEEIVLNVPVLDPMWLQVEKDLEWIISGPEGNVVASGETVSPSIAVPVSILPSGEYTLKCHIKGYSDDCSQNVNSSSRFIIWRKSDRTPPVKTPLWVDSSTVKARQGAKSVKIRVGSSYSYGHILAVVASSDGSVITKWLTPNGGFSHLEVPVPADSARIEVSLYAMHDLKLTSSSVTVLPASQWEQMEVKTESFRDHINPGDEEHWSFRFSVAGRPVSSVPAMAVLYDKALDALCPSSWNLSVYRGWWNYPVKMQYSQFPTRYWNISPAKTTVALYSFSVPSFNTLGNRLFQKPYDYDGVRYYGSANKESLLSNTVMMKRGVVSQDMVTSESVSDDSVTGTNGADLTAQSKEQLRPIEMPLAFFRPDLKADSKGVVNIDFIVPDFNTTWRLMLLGYDADLHSAKLTVDAVAARKVMVRSNPPRFVRVGDRVSIAAMLLNNSEENLPVGGRIELFDPLSGKILLSEEYSPENLAPSASRVVSVEWDVPAHIAAFGLRAYAIGDGNSDGEQTLVTVLPASSDVVDSYPFWLRPGQGDFTMRLPEFPDDSSITLQYCDNPMWLCVTSLPLLTQASPTDNVLSLTKAYFGGAVAAGIAQKIPQVREAVEWLSSKEGGGSSLLKSALKKDSQLKLVDLELTPWLPVATADELRLSSLSELIDSTRNAELSRDYIDRISKLQSPSGGFSWTSNMEPSMFITESVLSKFALMKELGFVDFTPEMDSICEKAITFMDKEWLALAEKQGSNINAAQMLSYLHTRSTFDVTVSSEFSILKKKAIERIANTWRELGIVSQANAAVLLAKEGRLSVSYDILRSLKENAIGSPEEGMWFDMIRSSWQPYSRLQTSASVLRAFVELDPQSEMVQGLRQWILLSKQTIDWSREPGMAGVLASILLSEPRWLDGNDDVDVVVGGIHPDISQSKYTGEFSVSLDPKEVSGQILAISRHGISPAWGGVVSRGIVPMEEVKAQSLPDLSVTKHVYVINDDAEGHRAENVPLKVGDRVRVTVMVHCGRDMQYVTLTDERPACFEPADQLSGYRKIDKVWCDVQSRDSSTDLLIPFLPQGDFVLTYDCFVDRPGDYSIGIATVQSLYSPVMTAHSAGALLTVN